MGGKHRTPRSIVSAPIRDDQPQQYERTTESVERQQLLAAFEDLEDNEGPDPSLFRAGGELEIEADSESPFDIALAKRNTQKAGEVSTDPAREAFGDANGPRRDNRNEIVFEEQDGAVVDRSGLFADGPLPETDRTTRISQEREQQILKDQQELGDPEAGIHGDPDAYVASLGGERTIGYAGPESAAAASQTGLEAAVDESPPPFEGIPARDRTTVNELTESIFRGEEIVVYDRGAEVETRSRSYLGATGIGIESLRELTKGYIEDQYLEVGGRVKPRAQGQGLAVQERVEALETALHETRSRYAARKREYVQQVVEQRGGVAYIAEKFAEFYDKYDSGALAIDLDGDRETIVETVLDEPLAETPIDDQIAVFYQSPPQEYEDVHTDHLNRPSVVNTVADQYVRSAVYREAAARADERVRSEVAESARASRNAVAEQFRSEGDGHGRIPASRSGFVPRKQTIESFRQQFPETVCDRFDNQLVDTAEELDIDPTELYREVIGQARKLDHSSAYNLTHISTRVDESGVPHVETTDVDTVTGADELGTLLDRARRQLDAGDPDEVLGHRVVHSRNFFDHYTSDSGYTGDRGGQRVDIGGFVSGVEKDPHADAADQIAWINAPGESGKQAGIQLMIAESGHHTEEFSFTQVSSDVEDIPDFDKGDEVVIESAKVYIAPLDEDGNVVERGSDTEPVEYRKAAILDNHAKIKAFEKRGGHSREPTPDILSSDRDSKRTTESSETLRSQPRVGLSTAEVEHGGGNRASENVETVRVPTTDNPKEAFDMLRLQSNLWQDSDGIRGTTRFVAQHQKFGELDVIPTVQIEWDDSQSTVERCVIDPDEKLRETIEQQYDGWDEDRRERLLETLYASVEDGVRSTYEVHTQQREQQPPRTVQHADATRLNDWNPLDNGSQRDESQSRSVSPRGRRACADCGSKNVLVQLRQTRSADEPPTEVCSCRDCSSTWRRDGHH